LIDKPIGLSSHAVVGCARRVFPKTRIGHLGTLDPFASGLLPLLIGGLTRMSDELMGGTKGYAFTIKLGIETDTLDLAGSIVSQQPVPQSLTKEAVEAVLGEFRGEIVQVPPVYCALKHNGRPLYEYMRTQGSLSFDIESKARTVCIQELCYVGSDKDLARGEVLLRTKCSKGTYIRSLARDIAISLGTVGHCSALRRIQVGEWQVDAALSLTVQEVRGPHQSVQELVSIFEPRLIPVETVFQSPSHSYPFVRIPQDAGNFAERVNAGNRISVMGNDLTAWVRQGSIPILRGERWRGFIETSKATFFADFENLENFDDPKIDGLRVSIEPKKQIAMAHN
jgi:tRNA pseudouridine(55) synthase